MPWFLKTYNFVSIHVELNAFLSIFNKSKFVKKSFEKKVVLFTNASHPLAVSISKYLFNELKNDIKIIIIEKHPYYLSQVKKQIIQTNIHKNEREKNILDFSIDIRNYQHVKKTFKILREEWGQVDVIFHFADYYIDKKLKDITINNFLNSFKWNQLTFFNLIKAYENIFINHDKSHLKILITQIQNHNSFYYYNKESIINYIISNHYKISRLVLDETNLVYSKKKEHLNNLKLNKTDFLENLLYQFLREKKFIKI